MGQVDVAVDLVQSDGDFLRVRALDVWRREVPLVAEEDGAFALAHGLQRHLDGSALEV
jgi:hypothetical protein